MNLVQMRHTWSLKAYVRKCPNAQMNATPKIDEFAKKCIFLGDLQKWVVYVLYKFPKFPEDVTEIIKIVEKIEVNGPGKKSNSPHNKVAQAEIGPKTRSAKNLGNTTNSKDKQTGQLPTRMTTKEKNHPMLKSKAAT